MILDDRGMGYFSDLDNCEDDHDEEDGVVDQDGNETIVDIELEEKAEVRLRQHKRPGLLRTRLYIYTMDMEYSHMMKYVPCTIQISS